MPNLSPTSPSTLPLLARSPCYLLPLSHARPQPPLALIVLASTNPKSSDPTSVAVANCFPQPSSVLETGPFTIVLPLWSLSVCPDRLLTGTHVIPFFINLYLAVLRFHLFDRWLGNQTRQRRERELVQTRAQPTPLSLNQRLQPDDGASVGLNLLNGEANGEIVNTDIGAHNEEACTSKCEGERSK